MAKLQLEKFMTPRGVAIYPHLTEADTKFDSDGVYHTKLALSAADAEAFAAYLQPILDAYVAETKPTLKPADAKKSVIADLYEEEMDDEGNETGRCIFSFKLAAVVKTKAGKTWEQKPRLFDSSNAALEGEVNIWSGSEVKVAGEIFPYFMASNKTFGLSLRCKAVQVLKLVSGGGATADAYGFDAEDGYVAPKPSASPFAGDAAGAEDDEF